jgi:hypothetical protein
MLSEKKFPCSYIHNVQPQKQIVCFETLLNYLFSMWLSYFTIGLTRITFYLTIKPI